MMLSRLLITLLFFDLFSPLTAQTDPKAPLKADTARARTLVQEARQLLDSVRIDAALMRLDMADSIYLQASDTVSREYSDVLYEKSRCFDRKGNFERALALGQQALALRLKVLGPDHPDCLQVRMDC